MARRNRNRKGKPADFKDKQAKPVSPEVEVSAKEEGGNDIAWWNYNPELLSAAAQFPFAIRPGMKLQPITTGSDSEIFATYNNAVMPGVLALGFHMSIGRSTDIQSPASIVAREIYGRIRKAYSGSTLKADAPDLFMYTMALDSAHAYIAHLKRIYGLCNQYWYNNRLIPDSLLRALGMSDELIRDCQMRYTEFWGRINRLVREVNKFIVPNDMFIYDRHRFMCEYVYKDIDSTMSQLYVFKPLSFYRIIEDAETGTGLESAMVHVEQMTTLDDLISYGDTLVSTLSNWDDAYTINGYMMRAYEGDAALAAQLMPQDYVTQVVYNEEMLMEIENFHPITTTGTSRKVTQNPATNVILCNLTAQNLEHLSQNFLNMHMDNPQYGDIAIATRFVPVITSDGTTARVECGTELAASIQFYSPMCLATGNFVTDIEGISFGNLLSMSQTEVAQGQSRFLQVISNISMFRHAPVLWAKINGSNTAAGSMLAPIGDLHNIAFVSDQDLANLHRVCMYSIFKTFGN